MEKKEINMCKGRKLIEKAEVSEKTLDHLINLEIAEAYRKGFMKGYNQANVLIDPNNEARNLAFTHASCDALTKGI